MENIPDIPGESTFTLLSHDHQHILHAAGGGRVPDAGPGDGGGQQPRGHVLDVCLLQRQLRDDGGELLLD